MAAVEGLRSAYARVGGLVYFGRMLDKIRLSDQNKLPPGYNLGDKFPNWFDGYCCRFLGIAYEQVAHRVRLGHSDEEILHWAYQAGRHPTEEEILMWNSFMTKRGWRDKVTASLNRWKSELGLADRADIETFFDLYDADEKREVRGNYSPE
jgi:Domain of unknown function (DUF5069)